MQVSVVVTVLNEADNILGLLLGLLNQTQQPNEVVVVDAGSTDGTLQLIKVFREKYPNFPLKVFSKKGNRSFGRNFGIKKTQSSWLALTDAGCLPHKTWLEELIKSAQETKVEVVAGYYDACPRNKFEAAVIPYMLVMPDQLDPNHFLPATRSMLFKKEVWQKMGGFSEDLTLSEDYALAHKIAKSEFKISFTQKAKVTWLPIQTWTHFFQTVSQMAEFDVRAGVTRIKAYLVFFRYGLSLFLASLIAFYHWLPALFFLIVCGSCYLAWSSWKNAQYLDSGWLYLPLLQLTADLGVMVGTVKGWFKGWQR